MKMSKYQPIGYVPKDYYEQMQLEKYGNVLKQFDWGLMASEGDSSETDFDLHIPLETENIINND